MSIDAATYEVIVKIVDERIKEIKVTREDFNELKKVVQDLAQAQARTETRVTRVETLLEELAQAQAKTETRVTRVEILLEELAKAQKRTEDRVEELAKAQKRTEDRVEELAKAQKRTEDRVEELAKAQKNTEIALQGLMREVGTIGSRWGIFVEETFRTSMKGLLEKEFKANVQELLIGEYQVDLLIKDGSHILVEITSSTSKRDINNLLSAARLYKQRENIDPKLIIVTAYISPRLYELAREHNIQIMSHE
jgi:hypothetical protein